MKMLLSLYDLDTENGPVEEFSCIMKVESPEEAEDNDNYYNVAMEWASEFLDCEVYSFEYYEWGFTPLSIISSIISGAKMLTEHVVTVYGVDSSETQGYTRVHDTLTYMGYPTDEEVLEDLEKRYGVVYFADFEVSEDD